MGKNLLALILAMGILSLCFLPARELKGLNEEVQYCVQTAVQAAEEGNWKRVQESTQQMYDRFSERKISLMMYLNHKDLSELEIAMRTGLDLSMGQDIGGLLQEMGCISVQMQYLADNEQFCWENVF